MIDGYEIDSPMLAFYKTISLEPSSFEASSFAGGFSWVPYETVTIESSLLS